MENNKAKYSEKQIKNIGEFIASLYGGKLIGFKVKKEHDEIIYQFTCIEHGELFMSNVKESEIEKSFSYCL